MKKMVLVIEDEADMRDAIADALDKAGFHVLTAENGQEGIDTALKFEPALILLDLLMPIKDGHSVLKELRASDWGKDAAVIVLTAMDDVANLGSAYEAGILDYVTKSEVSLVDLVYKVKKALGEA